MLTTELDNLPRLRPGQVRGCRTETPDRVASRAASPHFFSSSGKCGVNARKPSDAGPELAYKWICGKQPDQHMSKFKENLPTLKLLI